MRYRVVQMSGVKNLRRKENMEFSINARLVTMMIAMMMMMLIMIIIAIIIIIIIIIIIMGVMPM